MKITELIVDKKNNLWDGDTPTVVFFGDSVTQGCFDCYINEEGVIDTVFKQKNAYHRYFADILSYLYPTVPVNIINAGISGDNVTHACGRIHKDVLKFKPNLTVVCFGLNDCHRGIDGIGEYTDGLRTIFSTLKNANSEIIFMTPNMCNTRVSQDIKDEILTDAAKSCMQIQNEGVFDVYIKAACDVAGEFNIPVCDVYAKWKKMQKNGVDITALLANSINHPSEKMNWLFAYSLIETMME